MSVLPLFMYKKGFFLFVLMPFGFTYNAVYETGHDLLLHSDLKESISFKRSGDLLVKPYQIVLGLIGVIMGIAMGVVIYITFISAF